MTNNSKLSQIFTFKMMVCICWYRVRTFSSWFQLWIRVSQILLRLNFTLRSVTRDFSIGQCRYSSFHRFWAFYWQSLGRSFPQLYIINLSLSQMTISSLLCVNHIEFFTGTSLHIMREFALYYNMIHFFVLGVILSNDTIIMWPSYRILCHQ